MQALLAAMTIAGAFWVGVLAARRLRDWGEGRRSLDEGTGPRLALAAATSTPPDDARTQRVRDLVAKRLHRGHVRLIAHPPTATPERSEELGLTTLRRGDVITIEETDPGVAGDFIVDGVSLFREGGQTTVIATLSDASRRRWLVASPELSEWFLVEPVTGHGLVGEPPRNIRRPSGDYGLKRRGQASAAGTGVHGRPELPRVATYQYSASTRQVLWLERWDQEILMGEGRTIEPGSVSFLPGS